MSSNKWVQNEVFFQGFFPNRLLQVSRVAIFAIMRVPLMFVWDHWDVRFLNSDQFRESNWQVSFLFDRSWLFNMKKGSHRWQLYIWHILLHILYDTYDISYIYIFFEGRSTDQERGRTWGENKEREREEEIFSFAGLLPKWNQWWGMGQVKTRSQELNPHLLLGFSI